MYDALWHVFITNRNSKQNPVPMLYWLNECACMRFRIKITFEQESVMTEQSHIHIMLPRFVFDQVRIVRLWTCMRAMLWLRVIVSIFPSRSTACTIYLLSIFFSVPNTKTFTRSACTVRIHSSYCCHRHSCLCHQLSERYGKYSTESLAMLLTWLLRRSVQ